MMMSSNDKGKQRAGQAHDVSHSSSTSAVSSLSGAGRPDTLSPDTARVGDTHARTSRFLRKSRSKQQLRNDADLNGNAPDDGLPTRSPSIQESTSDTDTEALPARSPTIIPASPAHQAPRSSIFSSPLSKGSGNRQHAYSPQKGPLPDGSRSMGGWFSSMLSSSQVGQRNSNNNDDGASIRSFATVATSPSRLLHRRPARGSPSRKPSIASISSESGSRTGSASGSQPPARPAIAKIGGFDRILDRAMQFFTDSDSNADRCPDDIWLLGVRHIGWRSEQEQALPSPSRPPSGRPSMDTISNDSYFHVTESTGPLPQAPSNRLLASPPRRRLSKSSNRTVSSMDASSPPNIALPPTPPPKSIGLFKSRRATNSSGYPSSHFLERTTSSSSSASSAGRSEAGNSLFSPAPPLMEEPSGLPSPADDASSIFTFNTLNQSHSHGSTLPSPISTTQTYGWPPTFYHDFYSRLQLTYRSGFSPLPSTPLPGASLSVANAFSSMMNNLNASIGRSMSVPSLGDTQPASGLSSDTGWGCMLRTGQSLLANALLDVHLGRDFRRPLPHSFSDSAQSSSFTSHPDYHRYVRLISWFFDDPSPLSPFSIHKFALEGKKLGKQIGEWFGPSTAAGAVKVLANDFAPANLGVALAIDTTLYGSEVAHIARSDSVQGWNRPVLILVPLRLGLNGVNPIYYSSLQHYFTLPQCVGIAGGRPSSSYYFVGAQGNQLFYIDPHHTKPSVKSVNVPGHLQRQAQHEPLTNANSPGNSPTKSGNLEAFFANAYGPKELESFHCDKVRKMSLSALDPSMLVGLLCQSKADWDDLCKRMKAFPSSKDHHPIINIVQEMPAWMRKSSRTISGAGLNASTPSQKASKKSAFTPTNSSLQTTGTKGASGILSGDDLEGSSVEYADSDDWDIDDSDDEDNRVKSDESEQEDSIADTSIIIKPATSPFQEVIPPGSFESDEPDYRASRNGKSPIRKIEDLPPATSLDSVGSTSLTDDFERVSVDTRREMSTSPSDSDAVVVPVLPPKTPPTAVHTPVLEKKDKR